jgi:hypothetical protein
MKPKLILCLALVLRVLILCPNPVQAEDAANPNQALNHQQQLKELGRQVVEAQVSSQRKMLRQVVSTRTETYDFSMEARRAFTEMVETPEFLAILEKNGVDRSKPASRLARQLAFDHLDSSTNLRPAIVAWIKLSFSSDASWETAQSLYRKVAVERPKDFLPKAVTLIRAVQTSADADEWFTLFKEAYAAATQPKERALCVIILPSHAADLGGISDSESHLQKLSQWLADLEKTETAERLPALKEMDFIKFLLAFARKDYTAAAEWVKDSRVRAMRPLVLMMAGKPVEARQALNELNDDATVSKQERDTLASASKILDEMNAAAKK